MSTQKQGQQGDNLQDQYTGRKRAFWKPLLITTIITVALAIIAAWILSGLGIIPTLWASILSAIVSVLGLLVTLLPLVASANKPELVPTALHVSSPSLPQIIVNVPNSQSIPPPSPPPDKIAHHGIVGFPPPTDSKTIQQREHSVQEVYSKLLQSGVTAIVLTGIGGVGKSTLAALIYRYAEEQRQAGTGMFQDEAIWLTVNDSVTMDDLAGTLFEALGKVLPDFSSLSPHNQAVALFNALNMVDEPRLIILDQFENLLDLQTGYALADRPGVGEWLDAINSQKCTCRILLTSRPWPQGTREYPPTHMQEYHIKGLEVNEGIELLKKRGVEATEAELRMAVERCEGHAYSLTFLASLLQNHSLGLATIFKDLTYTKLWAGDIAYNLLDYIFTKQLSDVQRKLLLAFSVYREPVPLDAALAIIDNLPKAQVLTALKVLRVQHLIQVPGEGRYQLHAIVDNYAEDHFDDSSEQANHEALRVAHARAAQYYQQRAAIICPPREQRRQTGDVQPIIEAIWQQCQAEEWQEACNLIQKEGIFSDLKRWGASAILLELYEPLFPLEKWHPEPSQEANIYNNLGRIYSTLGRKEEAKEFLEKALTIRREIEDREGEGMTLNYLGRVYADLGQRERALEYLEQALSIRKEARDRDGVSATLNNLGRVYDDLGQKLRALEYYEQALSIRKEVEDRRGEGRTLKNIGIVYSALGKKELAREYLEQVLDISKEIGDRGGEGWALNHLGRIYSSLGKKAAALKCYEEALPISREVGDREGEAAALNNLGMIYKILEKKEGALQYLEQALQMRREIGDRGGECTTLNNLAMVYASIGEKERTLEYLEQALQICKKIGDRWREGMTLDNLGEIYAGIDKNKALNYYKQALIIRREIGDRLGEGKAMRSIGILFFRQSHYDIALACFLLAQAVFDEIQSSNRGGIQSYIESLHKETGGELFVALLAKVEPQASQIVDQALREEAL